LAASLPLGSWVERVLISLGSDNHSFVRITINHRIFEVDAWDKRITVPEKSVYIYSTGQAIRMEYIEINERSQKYYRELHALIKNTECESMSLQAEIPNQGGYFEPSRSLQIDREAQVFQGQNQEVNFDCFESKPHQFNFDEADFVTSRSSIF